MKEKIVFFINVLMLIMMVLVLSGCSLKPTYESESKIKKYVKNNYGKDYKLVDKKSYEDDTDEKNLMYEYIFENSDGNSFSIYSSTGHTTIDASETIFYSSTLSDNYIEKKVEDNYNEIDKILQSTNCPYKITTWNLSADIYSFSEIEKISNALYNILEVLDLEENKNTEKEYYAISDSLSALVTLYSGSENVSSSVKLKHGLSKNDIIEEIESDFMNYIANNNKINQFDVPEEKWEDFHTHKAVYDYGKFQDVEFYYDENLEDYYTSSLALCLNYDEYTYNHNDIFQDLVELNGGTFSRSGWTNTWTIGNNTWKATMTLNVKGDFKDLKVTKNGKEIDLQYSDSGENSIFQQYFTKETVEDLLDVTVTINNDGTVEIY